MQPLTLTHQKSIVEKVYNFVLTGDTWLITHILPPDIMDNELKHPLYPSLSIIRKAISKFIVVGNKVIVTGFI
jgi:hypothetical protein